MSHNNNQRNASKKAELTFVPALEEPLDLCEGQATNAAEHRVSKCSRKASQEKQPAHQRTYLDGSSSPVFRARRLSLRRPASSLASDPRSRLAGAVALAVVLMANRSRPPTKNAFTKPEAGRYRGDGAWCCSPAPPPFPRTPPHPACAQRARPGAVSVCAGPRKRAQLPPAALRLPVFYLLPPQNSAGFATASILARGFARGGGQIAAFPRPCKSAATAGACCALRLLMRDKHGHHCNASAGVQPWFVPESTSQLAGPEFDSRLLNLTPSSSI